MTVFASERVVSIAFESADGAVVDGGLFPIPDPTLGVAQVGLILLADDRQPEGIVFAYAADGTEIARAAVGG